MGRFPGIAGQAAKPIITLIIITATTITGVKDVYQAK